MKRLIPKTMLVALIIGLMPAQQSCATNDIKRAVLIAGSAALGFAAGWAFDIQKDKDRLNVLANAKLSHPYNKQRDSRPGLFTSTGISAVTILITILYSSKSITPADNPLALSPLILLASCYWAGDIAMDKQRLKNANSPNNYAPAQERLIQGFRLGSIANIPHEAKHPYNIKRDSRPALFASLGGSIGLILGLISAAKNIT